MSDDADDGYLTTKAEERRPASVSPEEETAAAGGGSGNGNPISSFMTVDTASFPDDTSDRAGVIRAVLAEFLGMAMFVFIGCGSVAATGEFLVDDADLNVKVNVARVLPIATAFGLGITVLAFSIGPISGGHMNPAVTFALLLMKKISPWRSLFYVIAQFLGSMLGAGLLWGGLNSASFIPAPGTNFNLTRPGIDVIPAIGWPPFSLGANQLNPTLSTSNGLLLEIMGTSLLIGTVLNTAVDNRSMGTNSNLAPLPIGISIWIIHLVLIPWTGCGINPARTWGPAVLCSFAGVDTWGDSGFLVYFLGPMLGSALTVMVTQVLWGGLVPPSERKRPTFRQVEDSFA